MIRITQRQAEVLDDLKSYRDMWVTPLYVGGRDGSDHSSVLRQLCKKGLARSKTRSPGSRGSLLYQITKAGLDVLDTIGGSE